jgi:hypothetical protein
MFAAWVECSWLFLLFLSVRFGALYRFFSFITRIGRQSWDRPSSLGARADNKPVTPH